jgi:hypothetical protein
MRQVSLFAIVLLLLAFLVVSTSAPTRTVWADGPATVASGGVSAEPVNSDDAFLFRRRSASYSTGAYIGQTPSTTSLPGASFSNASTMSVPASPDLPPSPSPKPPPAPPVPGTVSVPEPSSLVLLSLGLLAAGIASRRFAS